MDGEMGIRRSIALETMVFNWEMCIISQCYGKIGRYVYRKFRIYPENDLKKW
jgi:hypothetical protein